jgi:hypothetical protein
MATAALAGASLIGACAQTGGLGNILGGVLAPQAMQVSATVQSVDTRSQSIAMSQTNGQYVTANYDNRTVVVYQNQLYPVTSLEYGDQVIARLIDQGNNRYYTDSVFVTQPVNNGNNRSVYGGSNYPSSNVQSLSGRVQSLDYNNGTFTVDSGNGVYLTVTMPYRPSSQDQNRFNSLRVGDFVRFAGVFVNNNRVELRQFY